MCADHIYININISSNIPSNISQHIPSSCSSEACLKRMICYLHLALSTSLHLADIDSGRCRCCRGRTFVDGMNGISRLSEIWISETRHIPLSCTMLRPRFWEKAWWCFLQLSLWYLELWPSGPFVGTLGPTCLSCEPNGGRARGRPDSPEVYSLAYLSVDCYMNKNYYSLTFFDFSAVHLYSCGTFLSSTGWWYWVIIFPGKHQSQRQEKNSELLAISEERAAQDPSSWVRQVNMWCKKLWTTCFPWFAV